MTNFYDLPLWKRRKILNRQRMERRQLELKASPSLMAREASHYKERLADQQATAARDNGKRRALEAGHITTEQLLALRKRQPCCQQCGDTDKLEFDHIVPLIRGGRHHIDNMQTLCRTCNRKKGSTLLTNG